MRVSYSKPCQTCVAAGNLLGLKYLVVLNSRRIHAIANLGERRRAETAVVRTTDGKCIGELVARRKFPGQIAAKVTVILITERCSDEEGVSNVCFDIDKRSDIGSAQIVFIGRSIARATIRARGATREGKWSDLISGEIAPANFKIVFPRLSANRDIQCVDAADCAKILRRRDIDYLLGERCPTDIEFGRAGSAKRSIDGIECILVEVIVAVAIAQIDVPSVQLSLETAVDRIVDRATGKDWHITVGENRQHGV